MSVHSWRPSCNNDAVAASGYTLVRHGHPTGQGPQNRLAGWRFSCLLLLFRFVPNLLVFAFLLSFLAGSGVSQQNFCPGFSVNRAEREFPHWVPELPMYPVIFPFVGDVREVLVPAAAEDPGSGRKLGAY